MEYKFEHRTIIEQYDYMNLVEDLAYYMWDRFIEENKEVEHEYKYYDHENGDTFTEKGEDVFAGFLEDIENLINRRLQLEYHGDKREWRSKEELLRKPF